MWLIVTSCRDIPEGCLSCFIFIFERQAAACLYMCLSVNTYQAMLDIGQAPPDIVVIRCEDPLNLDGGGNSLIMY